MLIEKKLHCDCMKAGEVVLKAIRALGKTYFDSQSWYELHVFGYGKNHSFANWV